MEKRGFICIVCIVCFVSLSHCESGDFSDPIVLRPGDSYSGTTAGRASVNPGCNFLGDFTGPAVYFTIDSPPDYVLTLSTCGGDTDFESQILAFTDYVGYGLYCQTSGLSPSCDESGGVYYTITNGEEQISVLDDFTYLIAVTGVGSAEGHFVLNLSGEIPDETWDECLDMQPIFGPQSFMGRIYPDGSGTPICGIDSQTSVAWFSYQSRSFDAAGGEVGPSSRVTITTCSDDTDFDTVLFLAGELLSCDTVTCSEVSDNYCSGDLDGTASGSTLVFDSETLSAVVFGVTGKGASSGVYRLTITEEVDEVQDPCLHMTCGQECATPALLGVGEVFTYFSTDTPRAEVELCGVIQPTDYIIWYRVTSPFDTVITLTTCSLFFDPVDTVVAVLDNCENLSCIAYNDEYPCPTGTGPSGLSFNAVANRQYIVALATYDNAIGSVELRLSVDLEED